MKNYQPVCMGDTSNLKNEEWLEWRKHGPNYKNDPNNPIPYIPYTLGGSDMAVVMNCSPFKSSLRLYGEKHGDLETLEKSNVGQLEMGHLMETVLAEWFHRKTGATIINDTNMYQHPDHPWALANMDRRFVLPDGRKGILEIKTTNYRTGPEHWADDSYPDYYEKQLRFYMGVDNCDLGCFICCWGFNPETDIAIRWVDRDYEKEDEIFKAGDEFIENLVNGIPPKFNPGKNLDDAADAVNALYGSIAGKECELPSSFLIDIISYNTLSEEKDVVNKEYKELESKLKELKSSICQAMDGANEAFCVDRDGGRIFYLKHSVWTRKTVSADKLSELYPEVDITSVTNESSSDRFTVKAKAVK